METTLELLSVLRKCAVELWVEGDKLRVRVPSGKLTPNLHAQLTERKADIISFLRQARGAESGRLPITTVPRNQSLPLSYAQERLWFLDQFEPGSSAYNIAGTLRLSGPLNLLAFEKALTEIIRRHEVLRTTFTSVEGIPAQVISAPEPWQLSTIDLTESPGEERAVEVDRWIARETQQPFDLSAGPLLRTRLLQLEAEEYLLLFTMHHIISDGWSLGVLVREVAALYDAFVRERPSPLPELAIQYADFAWWQREWMRGEIYKEQLSYWKRQLEGIPEALDLPTDRPRPAVPTFRGAACSSNIPLQLSAAIDALCERENVTRFMLMLAAFKALLYRYTGQRDLVVGSPIANRHHPETEGLIGFFVNEIVLRTHVSCSSTFRELLQRVREAALNAYAHQDLPFVKLVEELQPERKTNISPLFQVAFVLQNAPLPMLALAGVKAHWRFIPSQTAKFDLTLYVWESDDEIEISIEYATDLFEAATVARTLDHYQTLLEGIIADPARRIADLPLMREPEKRHLLIEWNETNRYFPGQLCAHQLFEAHAQRTPEALAVAFENRRLTYRELNCRANQLAHHLRRLGVRPESLVSIFLDRSIEMIVGILGVLKAGGAYLPLDLASPPDRLALMLAEARAIVTLTSERLTGALPPHNASIIRLDADWKTISGESRENPLNQTSARHLAYVIYTSGTTGAPKGVMIEHRGLVNLVNWQADNFNITGQSRILQFFSYSFDGAVGETFMALLNGAALMMAPEKPTPAELLDFINTSAITVGVFVPSLLGQLDPDRLERPETFTVVSVGETCPVDLALRWSARCNFMNAYGPTEDTVYSHLWRVEREEINGNIPIGLPIHNTRSYILDNNLNPVPAGIIGEIYISGTGLARGYLSQPQATASKFIPNKFAEQKSSSFLGPLTLISACDEIARFAADESLRQRVESGRRRAVGQRLSPEEVICLIEGLDEDLVEKTRRFIAEYGDDRYAYNGFCRYFSEGIKDSYASCGLNKEVLRALLPFEEWHGRTGVDFCFGNAEVMQTLRKMGAQIIGIDLEPFFVQRARNNGLAARMGKVDLPCERFCREFGIEQESQDFVISTLALDRLESPRNLIGNMMMVLKEGGRFALQTLLPVIGIDDGEIEPRIEYTPEQNRIVAGETAEQHKTALTSLLFELGAGEIKICHFPYAVASGDGIQEYTVWSFFGRKRTGDSEALQNSDYSRLYRTGDLGRYRVDGSIEFQGRLDHQVKLRGFRIELGEIEAALRQHPRVREAAVIPRQDRPGERRLVAYLVSDQQPAPTNGEVRAFLKQRLPDYMMPSAFLMLDRLPLTPSGKVDRRALPAPDQTRRQVEAPYVAPRTAVEEMIASIWSQMLGIHQIGIHDNFFELGGHSLLATRVISRIRDLFEVELPLRRLFELPILSELAGEIEALKRGEAKILTPPLTPAPRNGALPLSFAQERLWFLDQLVPDNPFYNMPAALRLSGPLHIEALEQVLTELVRRHEVLRTTFKIVEGRPVQEIAPVAQFKLAASDLSGLANNEREAEARRQAIEEAADPFDLARGPLMRARLLRLSAAEHVLLFTMHHIIADGWSLGVLVREVTVLYDAFIKKEPSRLPELPVQYADFSRWQREWLTGDVIESQLAYWKQQLSDVPVLELPTDRYRPAHPNFRGAKCSSRLPEGLAEKLNRFSRREGATLYMTLLAAFQTLLLRYCRQTDITIGSPIANRTRAELEPLIGFFVNTLVLRTDLSGNPSFPQLVKRVREVCIGAYEHQDAPFEKLVEELQPERSLSHTPLFQVMFALQNAPAQSLEFAGVKLEPVVIDAAVSKFDLTLEVMETNEGLTCLAEYSTELFDAPTIERLLGHYGRLLEGAVADPDARVWDLQLLSEQERNQLLVEWSGKSRAEVYEERRCIHEIFEAQVGRTPNAVAIVYENERVTYAELDRRANQLARYLRRHGVGPEARVGLLLERSVEMVVGLLGVLKAGGAYVPLDPNYPQERLAFMLEDAGVGLLLTQQNLCDRLPMDGLKALRLDLDWPLIAAEEAGPPASEVTAKSLAYVIYTSGSTGRPKGALVEHAQVTRLFAATHNLFRFGADDVWTLFHSYAFDFSVWEIWGALLFGARLVIIPHWITRSPEEFYQLLSTHGVTVLNQTPSAFRQLMLVEEAGAISQRPLSLRYVIFGGEALEMASIRAWFARHGDRQPQMVNMYGITETTVHVTHRALSDADVGHGVRSLIGRSLPDLQLYVLDPLLKPAPIGVPGDIYVGGAGVARGYLGRPDLTAERFVPDLFSARAGARLYRAGDMARYLANGELEYLGRIDHQVKIRGYRIELGEIEAALALHEAVHEAVVTARDEHGDKRLIAYVVERPEQKAQPQELRLFLKEQLPDYMVPAEFVMLDAMPLTPSGKVDRQALPAVDRRPTARTGDFVAPRDELERQLIGIWEDILNTQSIGVMDDFFDRGGHSLLVVRLFTLIEHRLNRKLPLSTIFQGSTVEHLAEVLRRQKIVSSLRSPLVEIQPRGARRPFFCIHPAGGNVLCYTALSRHLGAEQPFFGLQARGLDGVEEFQANIADMAADYVRAIRAAQPEGPYLLGGWSMGGLIAFEMAQQLRIQGERVALLALIDSALPDQNVGSFEEREGELLWVSFAQDLGLALDDLAVKREQLAHLGFEDRLSRALERARATDLVPKEIELAEFHRLFEAFKTNVRAMQRYAPRPYQGSVSILWAKAWGAEKLQDLSDSWRALVSGSIEIYEVPGDHYSIMRAPHVALLAERLKTCIEMAGND